MIRNHLFWLERGETVLWDCLWENKPLDPLLKDEPIDHTGILTNEITFLLHKSIDLSSSFGAIQLEQMKEKVRGDRNPLFNLPLMVG